MSRPLLVRFSSALPLLALLACKLGKDDEQSSRPLPTPEPASTTPPSRPIEADPPRPKEAPARPPSEDTPSTPKPATPTPTPTPTPTATTTSTATATADAAAPTATADAGAQPPTADRMTQCITKCQASLSACISKPVPMDGGVPSLESMSECRKVFEDCRTACTP